MPQLQMAFHAPAASDPEFFPVLLLDGVLSGFKGPGVVGGETVGGVEVRDRGARRLRLGGKLLIGADGRDSRVAKLAAVRRRTPCATCARRRSRRCKTAR